MIIALLLAAAAPVAVTPAMRCPTAEKGASQPAGIRAVVADDGRKAIVRCGDGTLFTWHAGAPAFEPAGKGSLFAAARDAAIVPADLRCPYAESYPDEHDCDVLDHLGDTWVLRGSDGTTGFVVRGATVLRESGPWQAFGALVERNGAPDLYLFDGHERSNQLQRWPLRGGNGTAIAKLARPNLVFEDGEGTASQVVHAPARDLLILSFGGVFRVATEMTFLRAFTPDGVERWHLTLPLPGRDDSLIVGDFAQALVMDGGRHLLFGQTSHQAATQVIDAADGRTVATLVGWPLAASRDGQTVVMQDASVVTVVTMQLK